MKTNLADLSPDDCLKIHEKMIANSNKKWESGEILAKNSDYAGAINMQIVSIEECIKGLIFFLDSQGFEFRKIQGIESILRKSHKLRHYVGFIMLLFNTFLQELKSLILKIRSNPDIIRQFDFKDQATERRIMFLLLRKLAILGKEFQWFERLESLRQKSSHVDYDPTISTPNELNNSDFIQLTQRLNIVREMVSDFINTFSDVDPTISKEIYKLKKKFVVEGWYKKIEGTLATAKSGRKNPFSLTESFFRDAGSS